VNPVAADARDVTVALIVLTFSTGLIDAISFIALGHVFTANMTGNIVFLAFAVGGASGRVSGPTGAAARLGIPSTTLESKIKSLIINKNRFKY
jgi:hypothetical protein